MLNRTPIPLRFAFRLLMVCLALVPSAAGFAQDDLLLVSGTLTDDGNRKKMPGVEVVVYQDGVEYDRMTTDARASYSFELPLRHDYVFSYEFDGYGNKRIQVDASNVPLEDLKGGFNLDLDMTLFTLVEGFDVTILEEPYGKASFDSQRNTVAFDFAHTDRMRTKVDNEFDRVERMAEQLAQMKKDFADLMTRGQQSLDREDWEEALNAFTDALALFADDAQAQAKQAEAQAGVDAARAAEQLEADFRAALESAESALRSDRLDAAREAFLSAQNLKPAATEPADGLARVAAREQELGTEALYAEKISAADKAFAQERFDQAKSLYEEASVLDPSERYPRDRAADCQARMDALAADAAALAARAAEYEGLIELADKNYRAKNWRDALRQYEEAASLMPAESHPVERAELCRKNLEEADEAAAAAAAAANAAAADAERDAAYQGHIDQGDVAFEAGNWAAAVAAYEAALGVKPNERYPVSRLERVEREQEREAAALADAAAADAAAAEAEANRRAAEAAAREAAAAEAAAQADREARAAAAAEAEAEQEARRRAAEEDARRRAQEAAAALDVDEDDEAEAYYREALASERRAKAMEVEREKEQVLDLNRDASDRAKERREAVEADLADLTESTSAMHASGASQHARRVESSAERKALVEEQSARMANRGQTLSRDGMLDVRDDHQAVTLVSNEHRYDYRDEMPAIEGEYRNQADRNADWSRVAVEYREVAYETATYEAAEYAALGEGERERLRATQADINATQSGHAAAELERSLQAEDRRYEARQEVLALDRGSAPAAEDYELAPEDADVAPGIQEQSYDIPNGLVIERTVRVGNHVRRFRKVVTRTGVYYFEGDDSITEATWRRETTVILD